MAETWETALDRLEADVAAAERLLAEHDAAGPASAGGPPAVLRWSPPEGLGPLPARLAGRARLLAAAQADLTARLGHARTTAAHHLAVLRAVPSERGPGPVYLDVEG